MDGLENDHGLFQGTVPDFAWMKQENH